MRSSSFAAFSAARSAAFAARSASFCAFTAAFAASFSARACSRSRFFFERSFLLAPIVASPSRTRSCGVSHDEYFCERFIEHSHATPSSGAGTPGGSRRHFEHLSQAIHLRTGGRGSGGRERGAPKNCAEKLRAEKCGASGAAAHVEKSAQPPPERAPADDVAASSAALLIPTCAAAAAARTAASSASSAAAKWGTAARRVRSSSAPRSSRTACARRCFASKAWRGRWREEGAG